MCDSTKLGLIWATALFGTASSIAWAISVASIYSPVKPAQSAKEICAGYSEARNTPFCMEIARQQ